MGKQIWLDRLLILAFILPLILYLKTLLPSVGFWDTGEFQTVPYTFDIAHPTGYPTYLLVGKVFTYLFPFGEVAWRMNLLSALCISGGLFILALLIAKITKNVLIGIFSGIFLATNPYLWSIAIRADPHALHFLFTSAFLMVSFKCIEEKTLKLLPYLSVIVGLSIGNHMTSVFFVPPLIIITLYLLRLHSLKENREIVILSLLLFLLGVSTYLLLPIISTYKTPFTMDYQITNLESFKRHTLGEDFQGMMSSWTMGNAKDSLIFYFDLFKKSFPLYTWILIIPGFILSYFKHWFFGFILLIVFVSTSLFGLTYQNASLERYFIPSFTIATIWSVSAVSYKKILVTILIIASLVNIKTNYLAVDASNDNSAQTWAKSTLSEVAPGSTIFSWWSYSTPLWYLQKVNGFRQDVEIVNTDSQNWESGAMARLNYKNVYFIEEINLQNENLTITQVGNVYQIKVNNLQ